MIVGSGAILITGELVIDLRAREWCKLPYGKYYLKSGEKRYTHPNGCPVYGKNPDCPPEAPIIHDYIDLSKEHWLVYVFFNMTVQYKKLRDIHPEWSDKMCRNSRYWQGTVGKKLRELAEMVIKRTKCNKYTLRPEARGIHVIKTIKRLGIFIKTRPKDMITKAALVGCEI